MNWLRADKLELNPEKTKMLFLLVGLIGEVMLNVSWTGLPSYRIIFAVWRGGAGSSLI